MKDAFNSMGTFGKVVAVLMVAGSVKLIVNNIATTIRLNKEANSK